MYFLILDLDTKEVLYSTYEYASDDTFVITYISKMVNQGKTRATTENYQFGINIRDRIIFSTIRLYGELNLAYREHIRSKKIDVDILYNFAEKFSHMLNKDDIDLLKKGNFTNFMKNLKKSNLDLSFIEDDIIIRKLYKSYFPKDIEIRLIGYNGSGITTIFYLWFGLTISSSYEDRQIPYQKNFNGKHLMLKKFNLPRGFRRYITILLPKESFILYIVDSTNKQYINNNTYFLQCLRELEKNQKILIIANKQDLPDAVSPEEIAEIMEYPTIAFSATAPGASEKLKEIISNFLSD